MQISLDDIINTLNRMIDADSDAATALCAARVPCNELLADDETIQVGSWEDGYKVGIIGVLNGFFPTNNLGYGVMCAVFDQEGNLLRFRPTSESDWDDPTVGTDRHAPCSQDAAGE